MKGLTAKEEEVMGYFWEKGPLFVKQLLEFYEAPRPHFNTLSTIVRGFWRRRDTSPIRHTVTPTNIMPSSRLMILSGGR